MPSARRRGASPTWWQRRPEESAMNKALSSDQVTRYREDGFVHPVAFLTRREMAAYLAAYEALEAANRGATDREWIRRPHVHHRWAYELMTAPRLLDIVEDVIGPDILLWDTKLFPKQPGSREMVTWHQDATYAYLDPAEKVVTVWIAMTDARPENGGVRFLPGTHRLGQLPHAATGAPDNLLSRGQAIDAPLDETRAVDVSLAMGEVSLHSLHVVHCSLPNVSQHKRVGIMASYVAPSCLWGAEDHGLTMLVRGADRHGHFLLAAPPRAVA